MPVDFHTSLKVNHWGRGVNVVPRAQFVRQISPVVEQVFTDGCFFDVEIRGGMAIKTITRDLAPICMAYSGSPKLKEAQSELAQDMQLLKGVLPRVNNRVKKAYLRAKIDAYSYEQLCESVTRAHLVEQAIIIIWENTRFLGPKAQMVLVQPYIDGVVIGKTVIPGQLTPDFNFRLAIVKNIYDVEFTSEAYLVEPKIKSEYENLLPIWAPQYRALVASPLVDPNPDNFILTDNGTLVYIDYQPVLDEYSSFVNRNAMLFMLSQYGY